MKLTALFMVMAMLQVSARGLSQNVTISGKNLPLKKIFSMIRQQTGLEFIYDPKSVESAPRVSLDFSNAPVEEVLKASLKGQDLSFSVKDKLIAVYRSPTITPLPAAANPDAAQTPPVSFHGLIQDENGLPLEGATIIIRGYFQICHLRQEWRVPAQ